MIQNAVDAINRTDPVVQGEIYLQIDCIRKEISIRDNGCGIAPENLGRIFEAFEQENADVSHKYGGTGLGLSIVHKIVEAHDGTIEVASTPGEGTVFKLRFPFVA